MNRRLCWALLVFLSFGGRSLPGQVVRGRVTDPATNAPLPGAVVSLLLESVDSTVANALTSPAGQYALRAPLAGRYRLSVKRIGVRRYVSAPFGIAQGQSLGIDVPIEAVAQTLPAVDVSGLCVTRATERGLISSLWDEVRTALDATEISLRDQLFRARVTRYSAELDPRSLQALFDWQSEDEVLVRQPFTSVSGDSLSRFGYWRDVAGDSVEFLAPDARALTSAAFLRDHCFSVARDRKDRPRLMGLEFRSVSRRTVPGISGTIWIDATLFELRFVEFRYTSLPPHATNVANAGGEVHFTRLTTGSWIVDRWFIRAPQLVRQQLQRDNPSPLRGTTTRRVLLEGGGTVNAEGLPAIASPAAVDGIVVDSGGRPLVGAVVRAVGTNRTALTATDGTFRLDSLPAGNFAITAHAPDYDSLATLVGTRRVDLDEGAVVRVDFAAPNGLALRSLFCPMPNANRFQEPVGEGVLRLVMIDSTSAAAVQGVVVVVAWPPTFQTGKGRPQRNRYQAAVTDNRGAASFCHLPTGIPLELTLFGSDDVSVPVMTFQTTRQSIVRHVLRGSTPP